MLASVMLTFCSPLPASRAHWIAFAVLSRRGEAGHELLEVVIAA